MATTSAAEAIAGQDAQRSVTLLGAPEHGAKNAGRAFATNRVVTSHYTMYNFIPKNLTEQFSKPANCYFLFLCILQCLPEITTTGQAPTISLPLSCIICMNAIKDAIEDYRRHKSDKEENERSTLQIARPGQTPSQAKWCDIQVGDCIVIRSNEYVPADVVLLTSAHETGQAFIETANLDGETNLKTKQAPDQIFEKLGHCANPDDAAKAVGGFESSIVCEGPNASLYTFIGTLTEAQTKNKIPLDEQHVVLRGCKIKNVQWCLGLVVYTGKESKIMMNSQSKTGRKLSHLERDMGWFTALMFIFQAVLCFIAAMASAVFDTSDTNKAKTYLNLTDENNEQKMHFMLILVVRFFNFLILFMNFIPISLLVSVNFVKLIQAYFIYCDRDMIFEGIHCMPRTSDLNEELGQVEYVFSDKTGTLTRNVMDFRKFCVQGVIYGEGMTEIKRNVMIKMGQQVEPEEAIRRRSKRSGKLTPHVDLIDSRLDELMTKKSGSQYNAVRTCLMHLAINHEVIPDQVDADTLTYSASSPDESALAYGARHFGFVLKSRNPHGVTVQFDDGQDTEVRILVILKFNSTRKRSSVIAEFQDVMPDGSRQKRLVLFTKGADSVILERLTPALQNAPETKQMIEVLKEMAEDGLRTLCLGGRELTREEFDKWMETYNAAAVATEQREEKLDSAAEDIEKNLEMHGITGIEDRLQEDVGGTIVAMAKAGIKVWMLTGDKTETAINIGIATGLLEPKVEEGMRPIFSAADFEDEAGNIQEADIVKKLRAVASDASKKFTDGTMFEGMVMDGKCLETALCNEELFVEIAKVCKTVVCCRVSPKQKGAVVRLIKSKEKAITLAIGDGANDCNMIQSADVGIGIRGLEGLQAFNVCDYGISQFRFLSYLLLVHGRWCYRRVAILVNYTFYKNTVLVLPQYYLGMLSGFSGQKLYNDFMYQMYNVIHSFLPIMLFGVLDQDVSKTASLANPKLYALGTSKAYLNFKVSSGWLCSGVYHSLCVFWIPYFTMSNGNITNSDGKSNDIWMVGTVVYLLVVIVVNLVVLLETCHLNWITFFGIGCSFFGWFMEHGFLAGSFTAGVVTPELHGTIHRLLSSPMLFLVIIASVAGALMVDVHIKGIVRIWFPSPLHEVHDAELLAERKLK